eukprot:2722687-Alexandrium_andersonii.AAC.1
MGAGKGRGLAAGEGGRSSSQRHAMGVAMPGVRSAAVQLSSEGVRPVRVREALVRSQARWRARCGSA